MLCLSIEEYLNICTHTYRCIYVCIVCNIIYICTEREISIDRQTDRYIDGCPSRVATVFIAVGASLLQWPKGLHQKTPSDKVVDK